MIRDDKRWHLRSLNINEIVFATDHFAAWDSLRDRPAEDFGLIVEAEVNEDCNYFPVRTSMLMYRWGREEDAQRFIDLAIEHGYPDTTRADREAKRCK